MIRRLPPQSQHGGILDRAFPSCTLVCAVVLPFMSIAENIARVRERMDAAARRAARNPDQITLMAVTKTVTPERIREAYRAGIRWFGENRVQEFAAKFDPIRDLKDARWHMIGHLQSNKASRAVELFDAVDSVDSLHLARKLNIAAPALASLDFQGLMAVPPYSENPEDSRPYFRKMRELFHAIEHRKLPSIQMNVLSMGMSHDFEVALEEGATCVRPGTAIFGKRPPLGSNR